MSPFSYARPTNLGEALARLRDEPDARPIAGGMTLIPTLKQGLASVGALVDLAAIDSLYGIREADDRIEIGAMTRHHDVATSHLVRDRIPGLAALAGGIGDFQVRNRGTIGGSVANNDPAADYPAALLALAAVIVTDRRRVAADDFFTGMFATALDEGEVGTAISFPTGGRGAYAKFAHPVSGFAMTGVYVVEREARVRVAVTGAGPGVFRSRPHEAALAERLLPAVAREIEFPADDIASDFHAPAAYRAHLISVMAERAVRSFTTSDAAGA